MPEIAILFIKEDMGVNNIKVRSILEESMEIGEILNEREDNYINC